MTTRAIIFDYDGVLTMNGQRPTEYATADQALGFPAGETYRLLWETDPWQKYKRGQVTEPEFWQSVLPLCGLDAADEPHGPLAFLREEKINTLMLDLARRLQPHYRLAILSNATLGYEPRWLAFGLYDLFDLIINSARVGMAKPDASIYRLTLDLLGCAPDEVIFIDDKPRNTLAAEALGIPSIVFTDAKALETDLSQRGILDPRIDTNEH